MTDRQPFLIPRDEILTIGAAARYARRSEVQIRRWCQNHGISRQVGRNSPHDVSRPALDMVLTADWPALAALKAGDRASSLVLPYLAMIATKDDDL